MGVKKRDLWKIRESNYYLEISSLVCDLDEEVLSFNNEDIRMKQKANLICSAVNSYLKRNGKKEQNKSQKDKK